MEISLHFVVKFNFSQILHFNLLGVIDNELVVVECVAVLVVDICVLTGAHGQLKTRAQCLV